MVPRDADEKSAASRLETGSRHALLHVVPRSLQSNGIFDGAHADHRTCPWIPTGQDDDGDVCHDANGCKSVSINFVVVVVGCWLLVVDFFFFLFSFRSTFSFCRFFLTSFFFFLLFFLFSVCNFLSSYSYNF